MLDNSVENFTGSCGNERRGRREDGHAKVNMEQQVWNEQEITDLTRNKKCSLGVETYNCSKTREQTETRMPFTKQTVQNTGIKWGLKEQCETENNANT